MLPQWMDKTSSVDCLYVYNKIVEEISTLNINGSIDYFSYIAKN